MEDLLQPGDDLDAEDDSPFEPRSVRRALIAAATALAICALLFFAPLATLAFAAGVVTGWFTYDRS